MIQTPQSAATDGNNSENGAADQPIASGGSGSSDAGEVSSGRGNNDSAGGGSSFQLSGASPRDTSAPARAWCY